MKLAANPTGVLVPNDLLIQRGLKMGDTLRLGITTGVAGQSIPMEAPIIGTFDLFPHWYPEDGTMIVGNIEELFLQRRCGISSRSMAGDNSRCGPGTHRLRHPRLQHPARPASRSIKTDTNGLNTIVNEWSSAELNIRRTTPAGTTGVVRIAPWASSLRHCSRCWASALRLILLPPPLHRDGYAARHRPIHSTDDFPAGAASLPFWCCSALEWALPSASSPAGYSCPSCRSEPAHSPSIRRSRLRLPGSRSHRSCLVRLALCGALAVLSSLLVRMKIFQAIKLGETT